MGDSDDPKDWEITSEDIEREREHLQDNVSKYPGLRLVLSKIDDAADPERAPATPSQAAFRRALIDYLRRGLEEPGFLPVLLATDTPTGLYVQYVFYDGAPFLDLGELDAHAPGFAAFVDNVHDRDLLIRDYHGTYQVEVSAIDDAFELGVAGLRALGALANTIDVRWL